VRLVGLDTLKNTVARGIEPVMIQNKNIHTNIKNSFGKMSAASQSTVKDRASTKSPQFSYRITNLFYPLILIMHETFVGSRSSVLGIVTA
jgi:hypothetical protein